MGRSQTLYYSEILRTLAGRNLSLTDTSQRQEQAKLILQTEIHYMAAAVLLILSFQFYYPHHSLSH